MLARHNHSRSHRVTGSRRRHSGAGIGGAMDSTDRRRAPREQPGDRARSMRRLIGQLGGARIAIALLLLLISLQIAAESWRMPLLRDAENALYDLRAANFAPGTDTDKRLTMVVYTADTNRAAGQISPVDRTVLAKALREIDKLGPKAIGVDVLFDSPQDDDPLLQDALKAM